MVMQKKFKLFVIVFFCSYVVLNLIKTLYTTFFMAGGYEYRAFEISDWLINYEGGFVRRGLLGQILYWLSNLLMCDVRVVIMWVVIITSTIFLGLVYMIFRKEGFSPLIIPTGCFAGFTLFSMYGRRDMLTFLFMYLIFLIYRRLLNHPKDNLFSWVIFYTLSIILILIHESAFFYTFPFLIFICYNKNPIRHSCIRRMVKSIIVFSPVLLAMGLVCIFKGNKNVAEMIWASWTPIISMFPDLSEGGKVFGIDALTWNLKETIFLHLSLSYLGANASFFRIFVVVFNWVAIYYLLTRLDVTKKESDTMNHEYMSNILLIQFVFMIPMFGILSSDWGRTLPYWSVSSVFIYHIFKIDLFVTPSRISSLSQRLQGYIMHKKRIFLSPYFYMTMLLVTPFSLYWAPDLDNLIQTDLLRYAQKAVQVCTSW